MTKSHVDSRGDSFELIARALRESARRETLPSEEFLKRCEEAGLRALAHRRVIERLREASRNLAPRQMPPGAYVEDLAHAAGLNLKETAQALNLPADADIQCLDTNDALAQNVAELLDISFPPVSPGEGSAALRQLLPAAMTRISQGVTGRCPHAPGDSTPGLLFLAMKVARDVFALWVTKGLARPDVVPIDVK